MKLNCETIIFLIAFTFPVPSFAQRKSSPFYLFVCETIWNDPFYFWYWSLNIPEFFVLEPSHWNKRRSRMNWINSIFNTKEDFADQNGKSKEIIATRFDLCFRSELSRSLKNSQDSWNSFCFKQVFSRKDKERLRWT